MPAISYCSISIQVLVHPPERAIGNRSHPGALVLVRLDRSNFGEDLLGDLDTGLTRLVHEIRVDAHLLQLCGPERQGAANGLLAPEPKLFLGFRRWRDTPIQRMLLVLIGSYDLKTS